LAAGDSHHVPHVNVTFKEESFDTPPAAKVKKHGGHH
jgi:hypothetical protein